MPSRVATSMLQQPGVWPKVCGLGSCVQRSLLGAAHLLGQLGNYSLSLKVRAAASAACVSFNERKCADHVKWPHLQFTDPKCKPGVLRQLAKCPSDCKGAYEWRQGAIGCCVVASDALLALAEPSRPALASSFALCDPTFVVQRCSVPAVASMLQDIHIDGDFDWVRADPERAVYLLGQDLYSHTYPETVDVVSIKSGNVWDAKIRLTGKGKESLEALARSNLLTLPRTQSAYAEDSAGQALVVVGIKDAQEKTTKAQNSSHVWMQIVLASALVVGITCIVALGVIAWRKSRSTSTLELKLSA
eukprot:NODE_1743_length_1078_cov_26.173955_g1420_i0.p1 GENE.NODE_1743_length_1078_cov_26.173955_g1420_i0~~NODE_1743_length_1078_cov_26.173955_g1420_i0.p1  ORF type:complete len:303 (+),score=61.10 NODE_1743_length_1078_cov_26.173955_g1420_i0:97-1005(+)